MVGGFTALIKEYRDIGRTLVRHDRGGRSGFKDEGDDFRGGSVPGEVCGHDEGHYESQKELECKFTYFSSLALHFPFSQNFYFILFWLFDQNLITFEKKAIDPSDPYELDFSKHKTKIEDNIKKLEAMRAKSAPKWWSE